MVCPDSRVGSLIVAVIIIASGRGSLVVRVIKYVSPLWGFVFGSPGTVSHYYNHLANGYRRELSP